MNRRPARPRLERLEDRTTPDATAAALVGPPGVIVGRPDGTVQVVTPDGTAAATGTPFPGYAGAVRTAAGADGLVAAGTGPGASSRVTLFDPATGAARFTAAPFEPSFTSGVFVAAADFSGSGTPDVVVTADKGGGPRVVVLDGTTGAVKTSFYAISDSSFRGGCRVATGDVTGDGVPDVICIPGPGGGPRVTILDGVAVRAGKTKVVADFFAFDPSSRNGAYVTAGDVSGDGYADVVVGGGPGDGPRVLILSGKDLTAGSQAPAQVGSFYAGAAANPDGTPATAGVQVAIKNLDADRKADLVAASPTANGLTAVTAYLGKTITPTGSPPTFFRFTTATPPTATGVAFVG